jgi:Ion channel inhibitory toxin
VGYNRPMRTLAIQRILAMSVCLCLGACGSSKPAAEAPVAQAEPEPPVPTGHPQCVDSKDRPIRCVEDSECCEGFVCGQDPELNPMNKYCIWGG